MDILIWLLKLLAILFIGVEGGTSVPAQSPDTPVSAPVVTEIPPVKGGAQSPEGDFVVSGILHVIESVDARLLESYPVQIHLAVTGYQPDGCNYPVQVQQQREGNRVFVRIFRQVPPDVMCPMNIVFYEATIPLEGGFESGTYTIDVNGVIIEVQI